MFLDNFLEISLMIILFSAITLQTYIAIYRTAIVLFLLIDFYLKNGLTQYVETLHEAVWLWYQAAS